MGAVSSSGLSETGVRGAEGEKRAKASLLQRLSSRLNSVQQRDTYNELSTMLGTKCLLPSSFSHFLVLRISLFLLHLSLVTNI